MKKIIIPIPQTDFDPTEAAIPWKILALNGVEVSFATPDGSPAQADERMVTGVGLGIWKNILIADQNACAAYNEMLRSPNFQKPIRWNEIRTQDYDGILLPGGHAPGMKPYLESEILQKAVADFYMQKKPVAAICHGVVLAARSKNQDGESILNGKKVTALLASQEMAAWAMTVLWLGNYYRTYSQTVQSEVTHAVGGSGQFISGPTPVFRDSPEHLARGFAVEDGHVISARWPGDAHAFSHVLLKKLTN